MSDKPTKEQIQEYIKKIVGNDSEDIDYAKILNEFEADDSAEEEPEEKKEEIEPVEKKEEIKEENKMEIEPTTEEIDIPLKRKHKYKPLSEAEKERRRQNCEIMRQKKAQKEYDRLKVLELAFLNKMQKKKQAVANAYDKPKEAFVPISLTDKKPTRKWVYPLYKKR